jgi:hypothetical protein
MARKKPAVAKASAVEQHPFDRQLFADAASFARTTATVAQRCAPVLRALIAAAKVQGVADIEHDPELGALWQTAYRGNAGEELVAKLIADESADSGELRCIKIGAAYAIQATKAERAGDSQSAWSLAFDAAAWEGFITGAIAAGDGKKALTERMRDLSNQRKTRGSPEGLVEFARAEGFTGAHGTGTDFKKRAVTKFHVGIRQIENWITEAKAKGIWTFPK